ncbi:hypothetical protein HQ32_04233 [Prauserella sp. Am3]|nr:hypothetical protein HQ32_04233 [Prauserella sp. Am3]
MSDWERFVHEAPWFLPMGAQVDVGEPHGWQRPIPAELPELAALLGAATVTPVRVAARSYELLAWGDNERRGWLCEEPPAGETPVVCVTHRALWEVFGGVVEQFGCDDLFTWWSCLSDVLTVRAAEEDVAGPLDAYRWIWEDAELEIPIEPADYYVVGVEGNGNLTLAHRRSGEVVLFAPDHDFDHVTPLPGCPPYSLLTIDGVPDVASWINTCASAWQPR